MVIDLTTTKKHPTARLVRKGARKVSPETKHQYRLETFLQKIETFANTRALGGVGRRGRLNRHPFTPKHKRKPKKQTVLHH